METTVEQLIERSYRTAKLYQRDRILDGSQIKEGLVILNEFLDFISSEPSKISFYGVIQFPITAGKKDYTFAPSGADVVSNKIVELKYVVIITSGTRYPVRVSRDSEYYLTIHSETAAIRPTECFLQNSIDKSTVSFVYPPDINYTGEIKAKFALSNLSLNTDISNVPSFYIRYLKYALAKELAMEYLPENWTQGQEQLLTKASKSVMNISDKDTTPILNPIFTKQNYDNHLGVIY